MAQPADPGGSDSFYLENGRGYGAFRRGQYFLPCDATERDRLDVMNTLIKATRHRDHRLHDAPFDERPDPHTGERPRVLDVGCGTGIWLLDMSEKYHNTNFLGIDLYSMGPPHLFDNIELRVPCDYEVPWALGEHTFDLIHLQMALGSVGNWPPLYQKIIDHLKPGLGWFESVEIDWQPRCDDNTLRPGKLTEWWGKYVREAYDVVGRSIAYNPNTGAELERAGFKDIGHRVYRIPLNGWSSVSRAEQRAGHWWHCAMASGVELGYGLEALSLAVLTRVYGWDPDHARRLCEDALQESARSDVHAYNHLHVWYGRAPHPNESR